MITGMNLAGAGGQVRSANAVGFRVDVGDSISAVSPAGTGTRERDRDHAGGHERDHARPTSSRTRHPASGRSSPHPASVLLNRGSTGSRACRSRFCVASATAASLGAEALIDTWNGSAWSTDAAPRRPRANSRATALNGVSCASAKFCIAVGTGHQRGPSPDSSGQLSRSSMRWNGATWSQRRTRPYEQGDKNELCGVSCVSSSFCVAVGAHGTEIGDEPVASWSPGTAKHGRLYPGPEVGEQFTTNELRGVSCVSSTFCVAVGSTDFEFKSSGGVLERHGMGDRSEPRTAAGGES